MALIFPLKNSGKILINVFMNLHQKIESFLKKETLDYFNVKKEIQTVPNFIDISKYKIQQQKCIAVLRDN